MLGSQSWKVSFLSEIKMDFFLASQDLAILFCSTVRTVLRIWGRWVRIHASAFYAVLSAEHTNGTGWEERARGIETGVLHMTFTPLSPALRIHPPICKAIPERLSSRNRCQLILCPYVRHLLVTHILLLQGFVGSWMLECSDTLWTASIPADAPTW